ncbi:MAG: ATP synthase F0 subunit B [Candidatus Portnoybacteria bacterium CG10_big_fil_rev_8_21_14_0_10_36_7]|uniref:ATP synthase subunit b n=1 Tax=Candidatus Portnoybacteria bacterium CG10_big_fil_rev_8_21_14_0_10_36_7 TaxID=1974812 RepID=A0A2M8KE70_9BACT|nr:MAG: ATP synthase F0 subunit B [Candidatus Portnoybacteria bacterium CG10_big_fil_rev_8_21_14_0_10_36_7]
MNELLATFNIDIKLLIAQLVNFTIVLLVLYKFAYKPILKILNDRTEKIEQGLKDAKNAKIKMTDVVEKEKEILSHAKIEAQKIISDAEDTVTKNHEEQKIKAKQEISKIIQEAKNQIAVEKEQIITEAKKEVAEIAVLIAEKILDERIDGQKDQKIISKLIK